MAEDGNAVEKIEDRNTVQESSLNKWSEDSKMKYFVSCSKQK